MDMDAELARVEEAYDRWVCQRKLRLRRLLGAWMVFWGYRVMGYYGTMLRDLELDRYLRGAAPLVFSE